MSAAKIGDRLFFLTGSVDVDLKKFFSYQVEFTPPDFSRKGERVLRHAVNIEYKPTATRAQVEAAVQDFIALHPAHLDLVERVGPVLEDVLVMDYWSN